MRDNSSCLAALLAGCRVGQFCCLIVFLAGCVNWGQHGNRPFSGTVTASPSPDLTITATPEPTGSPAANSPITLTLKPAEFDPYRSEPAAEALLARSNL